MESRVVVKGGTGERWVAHVVKHPASTIVGGGRCVIAEGHGSEQGLAAHVVVHPAAIVGEVGTKGDINDGRITLDIEHPTTKNGGVALEGKIGQGRVTVVVVYPTTTGGTTGIDKRSIRLPRRNDEPVEYGAAGGPGGPNHNMVAVLTSDVGSARDNAVAVSVKIVAGNVAAKDRLVNLPATLVAARLDTDEAAVDGHAVVKGEGVRALGAGGVDSCGNPNFVAARRTREGRLQAWIGINPAAPVVCAVRIGLHVADRTCPANNGERADRQHHDPDEHEGEKQFGVTHLTPPWAATGKDGAHAKPQGRTHASIQMCRHDKEDTEAGPMRRCTRKAKRLRLVRKRRPQLSLVAGGTCGGEQATSRFRSA